MDYNGDPKHNALEFLKEYSQFSIMDLDDIMETLEDHGWLSEKGMEFRQAFWEQFIKQN